MTQPDVKVERIVDHRDYATPRDSPPTWLDATALERELRAVVKGEVRFDGGSRALYSTDSSNYRQIPIGVVIPLDEEDVIATVAVCRKHGAPITSRGGGTSLAGQTCNVAVVLDHSKAMNKILELNPEERYAVVQPGLVLDVLRDAAKPFGLTYGPDPSTHNRCTLGGMIGNNSCGVHAQMAGPTVAQVLELDVLLYDGTRLTVGETSERDLDALCARDDRVGDVYRQLRAIRDRYADDVRARYPDIPRRISGYNLDQLLPEKRFHVARALVGTEGTCVVVLKAKVKLVPNPEHRVLVLAGFPDIYQAADAVPDLDRFQPVGLEAIDGTLVREMKEKSLNTEYVERLPPGDGWLFLEFGADSKDEAHAQADRAIEHLKARYQSATEKIYDDPHMQQELWVVRESGLGADARGPGRPDTWEGWEDSAVPPENLGEYLRKLKALFDEYGYKGSLYGHFGQGCVHTRITFDLTSEEGVERFRHFLTDAAKLVTSMGGSISGEHGDGQSKAALLPIMFGERLVQGFGEFKAVFDPTNKMNPGKVVHPYDPTTNLRLGAEYHPKQVDTWFRYATDDGRFDRAVLRCVGVGLCRRQEPGSGVMCPSYQATREEAHSTRGRAHLLFEMLQGDVVRDGWKDEGVKDALDLCLACKGCKHDCPVQVDVATYKAEFLAHYYEGRLRPRNAYAIGLIHRWARLAGVAPWAANAVGSTRLAKRLAGVHPARALPRFAPRSFRRQFPREGLGDPSAPRVVLWTDTFSDHFHPDVLWAGARVLADAGHHVVIPRKDLCCGRPLYDYGMLDRAKKLLERDLRELRDDVEAGTPIVGLEPSCVAVFRDELPDLLHGRDDAKRLSGQVVTLAEHLAKLEGWSPPRIDGALLVQRHCHHASVMGFRADEALLRRTGADVRILEQGCCGMAGGFGFERDHYDVSMRIARQGVLGAIERDGGGATLVADGFSCRTQVEQGLGRAPKHLAQLLDEATRPRR